MASCSNASRGRLKKLPVTICKWLVPAKDLKHPIAECRSLALLLQFYAVGDTMITSTRRIGMEAGFAFLAADRVRNPRLRLNGRIASKSRTNWNSWVVGKAVGGLMQRRLAVRPSFNLLKTWGCRELDRGVLSNGMCNVQSQCWSCIKCE